LQTYTITSIVLAKYLKCQKLVCPTHRPVIISYLSKTVIVVVHDTMFVVLLCVCFVGQNLPCWPPIKLLAILLLFLYNYCECFFLELPVPSKDMVTMLTTVAYLENTTQYLYNETAKLFAVTVDNTPYVPDHDSKFGSSDVYCASGYVRYGFFCGTLILLKKGCVVRSGSLLGVCLQQLFTLI